MLNLTLKGVANIFGSLFTAKHIVIIGCKTR